MLDPRRAPRAALVAQSDGAQQLPQPRPQPPEVHVTYQRRRPARCAPPRVDLACLPWLAVNLPVLD